MKTLSICILLFLSIAARGQSYGNFQLVDEFKINKVPVKVFFNDPLKTLAQYPGFDKLPNEEKHELLSAYLHNNVLYVFETSPKKGGSKLYALKGNEKKLRTAHFYELQVINEGFTGPDIDDNDIEKTIDKLNIGGTFFEHMMMFQNTGGKEAVGKLINIWGYFSMIQSYSNIKNTITGLIRKDMENSLPEDIIAKPAMDIQPLFEYETCAVKQVKQRISIVTVFQYDSTGKQTQAYPRTEKDEDLYHSSISVDDIVSVTALPFFSIADTVKQVARNIFKVNSTKDYLNHYLQNVKVFKNETTGNVERIEGTLLIHGYSKDGHSVSYEFYVAEFGKAGECFLPKTVSFYSTEDKDLKYPRIVTTMSYSFKE